MPAMLPELKIDRCDPRVSEAAEPKVRIVMQPTSSHRFRYKSEGRWAGSIPGANKNSFPTIEISGCSSGKAVILVSCVTKDSPYKTHPHGVVARELHSSNDQVDKGACKIKVQLSGVSTQVTFNNIGIHSCKQNEVENVLKIRKTLRIDPFHNGFDYGDKLKKIDLHAVRLCFQVFILDDRNVMRTKLRPVVSNIINDKKVKGELVIVRKSHDSGPATGGTAMILLCDKAKPGDIAVVFFEKENNRVVWEKCAPDLSIHKNAAVEFTTPPYRYPTTSAQVFLQLKRPSDNARSMPVEFQYIAALGIPRECGTFALNRQKYIEKKPLLPWLQSEYPVTIYSPPGNMHSPREMKTIELIDIPQDLEPYAPMHQQYPAITDGSYVQSDHHFHPPNVEPAPLPVTQLAINSPLTLQETCYPHREYSSPLSYCPPGQYTNGQYFIERNCVENEPQCLLLTSERKDFNYVEEMSISGEYFSDICEEQLSDHLSGLSLKDLIGTASNREPET